MDEHATVTAPQSHHARRTPARRMRAAVHEGVERLVDVAEALDGVYGAATAGAP